MIRMFQQVTGFHCNFGSNLMDQLVSNIPTLLHTSDLRSVLARLIQRKGQCLCHQIISPLFGEVGLENPN